MSSLQWFVCIFDDEGTMLEVRGPFEKVEGALKEAEATGYRDWDKSA